MTKHRQVGLRFSLVLASMSLVFIAWILQVLLQVKGHQEIENSHLTLSGQVIPYWALFIGGLSLMTIVPHVVVSRRIKKVRGQSSTSRLTPTRIEDGRSDVVAYLVAVLFPLAFVNATALSSFFAPATTLGLLILIFYGLDLFHINPLWAIFHWRVYSFYAEEACADCAHAVILITRHGPPVEGESARYLRITNHLYLQED